MGYLLLEGAGERVFENYSVRSVRQGDAELIRGWRNSQLAILRQVGPLSYSTQQRHFAQSVMAEQREIAPQQILLMLLRDGEPVGYGGLTHIDWSMPRGELSFLNSDDDATDARERYFDDFYAFLQILLPMAFQDLGFVRVWHETYGRRSEHLEVLVQSGFRDEGRLRSHVMVNKAYEDSLLYGILARDWEVQNGAK